MPSQLNTRSFCSPGSATSDMTVNKMSLEDKKKAVLANIAALKQQIKIQEEDAEYKELLWQEAELKRKLSHGSGADPEARSSISSASTSKTVLRSDKPRKRRKNLKTSSAGS